jgi:hypothetical protein
MKHCCIVLAVATFVGLLVSDAAFGQKKKPTAIAPAEKLPEGWEEIDQRLLFLMVRLANVETSLDAIERAIGSGARKKAAKTGEGKRAEAGNDKMDRKGGGPMKWSEFYGTTAEAFFYHPTDRNTTYHTTTVLSQQGPQADNKVGGGVPASQGVPVHQRPPQFDYIYRANLNAKERAEAEAAALKGKIEELAERRNRLETEQSGLWCEIAFRAVSHYDLDKKPLYRFEPLPTGSDMDSQLHAESMKGASSFMALALSIVDAAQKDQATTFSKIKPAVSEARQKLNDGWLQLGIDATDRYTTEGKFAALAKRLDDVASNLSDSYVVANEGEQAHDQQRKDTFRAMLQQSLVSYAQIILALDEMSAVMKNDWKIKPDVKRPIQFVSLKSVEAVRPVTISHIASNREPESKPIPGDNRADTAAPVGIWIERRPDTPVGNRIRNFMADGALVLSMPKLKKEVSGHWRRDGSRVYFQEPSTDGTPGAEKWFEIIESSSDQLKIRMEGQREYIWQNASKSTNDAEGKTSESQPASLFDGKSLDGWQGDKKLWRLINGAITGEQPAGRGGNHLFHGTSFQNFKLAATFRVLDGNSGIYFRAEHDGEGKVRSGYQLDLRQPDSDRNGVLEVEPLLGPTWPSPAVQKQLKTSLLKNEWNDCEIMANGENIIARINGVAVIDMHDARYSKGVIGLQLSGKAKAQFKDLTITRLP